MNFYISDFEVLDIDTILGHNSFVCLAVKLNRLGFCYRIKDVNSFECLSGTGDGNFPYVKI